MYTRYTMTWIYLLILLIVYFVFIRQYEEFGTVDIDTAKLISEKINQQAKVNRTGDFRGYLHFLDAIKNKNDSLEKLTTYYYWLEIALEKNLTYTDILQKF